jgi:hypothetical protein
MRRSRQIQQKIEPLLAITGRFTPRERYTAAEPYIWVCSWVISLGGSSFLGGMACHLVCGEREGNLGNKKGMELKDGTLFVIFRQVMSNPS